MADELKVANKSVRSAQLKLVRATTDLVEAIVERTILKRTLGLDGDEEAAEQPAAAEEPKKKKDKPAKKKEEKKEEEEDTGPVECAGNVLTETRCPVPIADRKRAVNTKIGKEQYPTCRKCKKSIAATRAEQRKAASAADGPADSK
jgi:hypothetical protein